MEAGNGIGAPADEDLVRAFTEGGDTDALDALIRRHESRVYGLAYRLLGNRADALDASQDAFISVFRKIRSFRGESAFTTWLYRLTVNACHDLARRGARSPRPMEVADEPSPDEADAVEARMIVERGLEALPPDQRTVLVLRELNGLSYEEVAAATGVPIGTVKSRIARARMALAEQLVPRHPGEHPREAGRLRGEEGR